MINLKTARLKKNYMTQTELARRSGLSRITIYNIENGKCPSVRTAKKIAEVLEIDWRDLYEK